MKVDQEHGNMTDLNHDSDNSDALSQDTKSIHSSIGSPTMTKLASPKSSSLIKNRAHMEQLGIHMDGATPSGQQRETVVQRLRAPLGDVSGQFSGQVSTEASTSGSSSMNPYYIQPGEGGHLIL